LQKLRIENDEGGTRETLSPIEHARAVRVRCFGHDGGNPDDEARHRGGEIENRVKRWTVLRGFRHGFLWK
jgi:hypothetical protein